MLIVFSGLPGSGKTTLARRLSALMGAVYIRIDSIEQAILPTSGPTRELGDVGYRVGYAVARDNLQAGLSVVADSVNPVEESRDAWRSAAAEYGSRAVEIEVICSDLNEHRQRVENRSSDIAGHVLPTWEAVTTREYHAWNHDRVVVDTAGHTVEQSLSDLIARVEHQAGRLLVRP